MTKAGSLRGDDADEPAHVSDQDQDLMTALEEELFSNTQPADDFGGDDNIALAALSDAPVTPPADSSSRNDTRPTFVNAAGIAVFPTLSRMDTASDGSLHESHVTNGTDAPRTPVLRSPEQPKPHSPEQPKPQTAVDEALMLCESLSLGTR